MVDLARLGLAVDSSQVEKGTVTLHQLTGAAGQAQAAANRLAGATQAEAAGHKAATTATQAHTAALTAQQAVMRSSSMASRQLMYQMVDMGQAIPLLLQSPIYGLQNMGFQIAQIGQMYYGQGGMGAALKDMGAMLGGALARIAPLTIGIAAAAAAVAGLTYEINKTSDVHVGFFDVVQAGWQLMAENIGSTLAPVWDWIVGRVQWVWDAISPILKTIGNGIIGTFVGAFEAIKVVWSNLPDALGDWAYQGAQKVIDAFTTMGQQAVVTLNQTVNAINSKFGTSLPTLGVPYEVVPGTTIGNPYAGAGERLTSGVSDAFAGAYGQDFMGDAFGALSARAQQIAAARQEMDELGGSAKAANDNVKTLAEDGLGKLGEFGKSVLSTLSSGFSDLFKGLLNGTKSATDAIADLLGRLGDLFIDQAFNMLFGGFGGGGMGGARGGLFGGSIIPGILHGGGVAGTDGYGHGRVFSPSVWANAPRYHNGTSFAGLRPNEVPAILERGERVIPANQNISGGQSVVIIRLDDGLRAEITQQAAGQAVQITRGMIEPVSRTVDQMAQQQRYA